MLPVGSNPGTCGAQAPRRVLIVDADGLVLQRLKDAISAAEFGCTTATSGVEAAQLLTEQWYPIVITDRHMPDMDGLALSRTIRSDPRGDYTYILMFSVSLSGDDLISAFAAGVDDYLSKEAGDTELLARLHAAQRHVEAETALHASEERYRALAMTLEERVAARTAELRALVQELESLCYNLAHHVRAPLRHASAAGYLLLEEEVVRRDSMLQQKIQDIIAFANAMGKLVDDLLRHARLRNAAVNASWIDTNGLVAEVRAELELRAAGRSIEWTIAPLPPVQGDVHMQRQLWTSLLENAVKFTRNRPDARISVTARATSQCVTFEVRDNGAGFDMSFAGKLFTPLGRLHSAREFEGNGIGLAIVRRIAERHGGRVWAEGSPGQGACFWLELPQRRAGLPACHE